MALGVAMPTAHGQEITSTVMERRSAKPKIPISPTVAGERIKAEAGSKKRTCGWFLHRLGEDAARTFRVALAELPRLELLPIDTMHHEEVVRKLERLHGRQLTYVDASSLVFLRRLRIAEVWGTDRDLGIEGARVVPVATERS
jgi:hypothetical protein